MAWGRTASSYTKTSKWRRSGRAQHSLLPLICYRRECATRHFTRRAASITLSGKIVDISFALPKPTTLEDVPRQHVHASRRNLVDGNGFEVTFARTCQL